MGVLLSELRPRLVLGLLVLAAFAIGVASCGFKRPITAPLGYENNNQACEDGLDNDRDGLIDCDDADCGTDPICLAP